MARINDHYLKLAGGYLFPEIGRRVRAFQEKNPNAALIRLGIGDVVLPIGASIRAAMHRAIDELGSEDTFKGYGPDQGYDFLREAIVEHDYKARGAAVSPDEVFVSDGSKCDSGNIQEIFATAARVAVPDPVYPVYVDTNVMAGRTGPADENGAYAGITYLPCTEKNGFMPAPPDEPVDVVYLCFPNNPTGAAATKDDLVRWVRWAKEHDAVILYDAAYEGYIRNPELPHSIYEVRRARGRDRVPQLLEVRRLHRPALRLRRRAEGSRRQGRQGQRGRPAPAVAAPPVDQVQRRELPDPGRRRGLLHRRGSPRAAREHRLLH